MSSRVVIVEGLQATELCDLDLRIDAWSLALDQRVFGPGRLVVAFTDACGGLISIAHTRRLDPPELALGACIDHMAGSAVAAVAFCDEAVTEGPPPPFVATRWAEARAIAAERGVHLVDWFACDDLLIRSARGASGQLDPDGEWWDVT